MGQQPPLFRIRGISKVFAGVPALRDIDLVLQRGEVHALVGENGAGKSTLIKILTGAYRPEVGMLEMEGREVRFDTPADAQQAGVVAIYQEINLLPHRTVAENIFIGREPKRFGLVDRRRMQADADTALRSLRLEIDPRIPVGQLSTAHRQMVAITRGVCLNAKVLIFDEPTSSLTEQETAILLAVIRDLKAGGTSIVYVSHRMDELYSICDRATVLRNGRLVMSSLLGDLPRAALIRAMLGKERVSHASNAFPDGTEQRTAPVLEVQHLSRGNRVRDVSLQVAQGEIVGMAGLLGSGRSEAARLMFGADVREQGEVFLRGRKFEPTSPSHAMRSGIGFVSEDRKAFGIIPDLSVRENLTLAALPTLSRLGFVSRRRQQEVVDRFIRRLGIRLGDAEQKIRELSGGNQQKVLLARALCCKPQILILDEPTRGIDIGARDEIQRVIRELADASMGVLMISSELEELIENCARVVVLRDGCTVSEVAGSQLSERAILHAMAQETVPQ